MNQASVRVFVSSPADVEHERAIVKDVIERLSQDFLPYFAIEPVLWEQEALTADRTFQAGLARPAECDIVLVVLWTRLGSPLPEEPYAGMTGTEWEFFDAVEGIAPEKRPEVLVYKKTNPKLVDITDPDATLEAIHDRTRLEEFFQRHFFNADGTFKRAFRTFDSDAAFRNLVEVQLRKLLNRRVFVEKRGGKGHDWSGSPFRADRPYEFADERIFTGRERETHDLVGRLQSLAEERRGFLLLSGPSGCGKTSLVRAGLLPRLVRPHQVPGVAGCRWCLVDPMDEGGDALGRLVRGLLAPEVLGDLLDGAGVDGALLSRALATEPDLAAAQIAASLRGLAGAIRAQGGGEEESVRLVLVVDPLEALLADDVAPPVRDAFCKALAALATSGCAWVIAVLGSDRLRDLPSFGGLEQFVAGPGWMALDAPPGVRARQIIEIPALVAGIQYESGRGQGVVDTLETEANRLRMWPPLLEGVLDGLYRESLGEAESGGSERAAGTARAGLLTLDALERSGGLAGEALRRASRVWEQLDEAARAALPMLCRGSIALESGSDPAPQAADLATLESNPDCGRLTRALVDARLLVADASPEPHLEAPCNVPDFSVRGLVVRSLRGTQAGWLRHLALKSGDHRRTDGDDPSSETLGAPEWRSYRPTVTWTHRALLARWRPAREWLAVPENRKALRLRHQIARQARLWKRTDCNIDYLLGDSGYAAAREFAQAHGAELDPLEQEFLARSADYLRFQRRRSALVRVTGAVLGGLLLMASAAAFWARDASQEATVNLHRSLLNAADLAIARGNTPTAVVAALDAGRYLRREALDTLSRAFTSNRLIAMARPDAPGSSGQASPVLRDDGERLATLVPGEGATLWRLERGRFVPEHSPLAGPGLDLHALLFAGGGPDAMVLGIGPRGVWRLPAEETSEPDYRCAGIQAPSAVIADPTGRFLAVARATGQDRFGLCLLDLAKPGDPLFDLPLHDGEIRSLAFSPDGGRLLTASRDGRVHMVGARAGEVLLSLPREGPLRRPVNRAVFDDTGERIATAAADERVRVYDTSGTQLRELSEAVSGDRVFKVHSTAVRDVVFSEDGRFLVAVDDEGQVVRWDLTTEGTATVLGHHALSVEQVRLRPASQRGGARLLLTASLDKTARLWDIDTGKELAVFSHDAAVSGARFSADGQRILTYSNVDGSARLWSVEPVSRIAYMLPHQDHVWHLDMVPAPDAVDPGRDVLLVATGDFGGHVKVWRYDRHAADGVPGLLWELEGHEDKVRRVRFSPSGRLLASAGFDGTVRVWDLATGAVSCVLELAGGDRRVEAYRAIFGPGEDWLVTASDDPAAPLRLWDLRSCSSSGAGLAAGNDRIQAAAAAAGPDGVILFAAGNDRGEVRVFARDAGGRVALRCELDLAVGTLLDLSFAPGGGWLAAAGESGSAALLELVPEGCATPRVLRGHAETLYSIRFSPDGTRVLTGSLDGTARLWDLSGATLAVLRGPKDRIYHAEFSPDGRWILAASRDGTLLLWKTPDGPAGELPYDLVYNGERGGVAFAAFSPDGHYVAAAYWENAAALWRLWTEEDGIPPGLRDVWGDDASRLAIVREADRFRRENHLD